MGLSIFIRQNGKALVEERLSAALKKEVHVGEAKVIFPFGLRFDNVQIKDALQAKALRIKFGIPLFFGSQFNIAKVRLTEPVFFITRSLDKKVVWGNAPQASVPAAVPVAGQPPRLAVVAASAPAQAQGIQIDYLEVDNGRVRFFDLLNSSEVDVGQINLRAMAISLPARDLNTKFDLTALVMSDNVPFSGRKIEARGTVNVAAHDMDATVKMLDRDGSSGMSAHLKSIHNDMAVKGKINVGRFVSAVKTKSSKESSFEGFLANALKSSGVEIGLDFACQTKMDDFSCDKISMSGNVVQTEKRP